MVRETKNKLKKIIYFIVFVTIALIIINSWGPPHGDRPPHPHPHHPHKFEPTQKIQIEKRSPIKINNDFPRGKQVTVDVVIPFIASYLDKLLVQLESWNEEEALPCDEYKVSHYYTGARSNLIFYLNFGTEPQIEDAVNAKIESSIWRKCFNQIKFIYANNTLEEDAYPYGITEQFYKYFIVGSPSDYFFWMETDVKPLKKNWQIELFRLIIDTIESRGDKAFLMMGSNYISAIEKSYSRMYFTPTHLNGNALYWNNKEEFYDKFLMVSRLNEERVNVFDIDITIQLYDPNAWDLVRNIRQEFITHDFIRNYNFIEYDKKEVLIDYPRTYFVHHSDGKALK